jgi:hypothetical protein
MIEVMRQVRNALVWNLNTDLDNIPACEQWSEMLRKNIDALDKAMADAELKWVGLTDEEIWETISRIGTSDSDVNPYAKLADARAIEAKLKEKNNG